MNDTQIVIKRNGAEWNVTYPGCDNPALVVWSGDLNGALVDFANNLLAGYLGAMERLNSDKEVSKKESNNITKSIRPIGGISTETRLEELGFHLDSEDFYWKKDFGHGNELWIGVDGGEICLYHDGLLENKDLFTFEDELFHYLNYDLPCLIDSWTKRKYRITMEFNSFPDSLSIGDSAHEALDSLLGGESVDEDFNVTVDGLKDLGIVEE